MIIRKLFLLAALVYCSSNIYAQVKIGNNPTTIDPNSILELEGSGKGVLMPRSTTVQIDNMTNVPAGMLLFNTTDSALYLKRDTGWVIIPIAQRGVNPTLQPASTPTYADFYALMPGDNPATVMPGAAVQFPQNGPISGNISRITASTFNLQDIGTYQVMFEVSISEPGELAVMLNGIELPYTVVGRSSGTTQITGMSLVTTTLVNSTISIISDVGAFIALTITPNAGGTSPVSAHLIITKLQ
jgi:hypothetical protein